ncbi:MAG: hypothetical protein AMJ55_01965 [Gammaproteobacteria bacterium SG8_15]|nr:MAG: hypothetical protein AMJ55_01965 [Gammaproteobacteria bacterium SG8_15]
MPLPSICYLLSRHRVARLFALIVFGAQSPAFAAADFWEVLQQQGKTLDIMSIDNAAGQLMVIGARYVEAPLVIPEGSEVSPFLPPVVRKQLYVMGVAANEQVLWQQTYPALPDVHEIYSSAASDNQRLCVLYGEQPADDSLGLDPVLLQLDVQGKILWAKRNIITSSTINAQGAGSLEQVANLDTLRVAASPDNGCVLTYVTRTISQEEDKFKLHVIEHTASGDVQWHKIRDTLLYGKMFLVHNRKAKRYVIVQTNQSRDAAVQAMMLAVPFVPKTALIGLDYSGEVGFQSIEPPELAKLWVKTAMDTDSESILLAGKTKGAWAGLVKPDGKIQSYTDQFDDEYSATAADAGGILLSRGDHLTLTSARLDLVSDQAIQPITTRRYVNQYLAARLPDDLPVQQIIPVGRNEYLLLYSLGSKLIKIRVENEEK